MIISWNTTNDCNMFCDHCYRDAGIKADKELDTKEGRKLIDEIVKAGFKIMIFSGGEPLMRKDIFELVGYANTKGLKPVFGTNGTLISKEVAKELKKAGTMGMGISLDSSNPALHDQLRCYEGAWEGALKGMENCKSVDLPFQVHTTVIDWNNPELENITDLAIDLGAIAHHFFFLVPTGRGKNIESRSLDAAQYEATLKRIMDKQKQVRIELKPTCAPQFMRIAKEMDMKLRFNRGCLAGTSYCIISPTGRVQPCAYLDMEIGNVRNIPFSDIWKNNDVFNKLRSQDYSGGCGKCGYKESCGGCRARAAYYHDGDYMAEEPWCLHHNRKGAIAHG
ncbi:putative heme d1 biosynthesis radical SAM protein NirJ2 [Serpentinicella sp. ANB-PHB4]|uniref:putative heme d1 biosynthesis radical SAM protein NirJ2 n=1 Tax=Serpentinicella sp. ANB-PHB4 TaxID=3074076 RepID=UPI0028611680|nr:putative heme d1 biosynthesis radical SAM protein NirJ2 [Serpentinicella sp. ANB-PHB4]MDR5659661.1 putative heme d1 biosynthesis radical SAM protein NirJ2 [Serpentinicella sp. ANB-PHB4]